MKINGKRVLVIRDMVEEKTVSGIILPEITQKKPETGTVVAIGNIEGLKEFDKVAFPRYAGVVFKHEDIEYLVLNEFDILGKFDNGKFIVMGERILIEVDKPKEEIKLKCGVNLYIPDEERYYRESGVFGTVKQLGSKPSELKENDRVLITLALGCKIDINKVEHRLIKEIDILAVL